MERIKLTRTAHRGQMTKLITKAATIQRKPTLAPEDIDLLTCTIQGIKEKLTLLATLDDQLLAAVDDEHCTAILVEADDYATIIKEKIAFFQSTLARACAPAQASPTDASVTTADTRDTTAGRPKKVNLPKLTLSKFSGDILQWPSFIDSFKAAVDGDAVLDSIQKFQYLRAQLDGEAAKVIDGLALTSANYTEAMALLQDRYGQPHKVRSALMRALWELPKPSADLVSLRTFFDCLQGYIRGLAALGKAEDSYGDLLVPIIQEKLPSTFRQLIAREHGNKEWTLTDLRRSINREIDAMEAGDIPCGESATEYSTPATTQAFLTHTAKPKASHTPQSGTRQKTCAFCKGTHFSAECRKVPDVDKRMEIVRRDYLCFNCLGSHQARSCRSSKRCHKCQRKHHTALCKQSADTGTKPALNKSSGATCTGDKPAAADNKETAVPTDQQQVLHVHSPSTTATKNNDSVLLKTAVADVSSGKQFTSATILFDEGATRSFITQELAQKLALRPIGQTQLQIAAFGSQQQQRTFDIARIAVRTKSGSDAEITALVVPTISAPIRNCVTSETLQLPHLIGLTLAQPASIQALNVSILIGADYYWSFVGDRVIRGNGPTAVESSLGYLLSGPVSRGSNFPTEVTAFTVLADTVQPSLEQFWQLETIGIVDKQIEDPGHDFAAFRDEYIEKRDNHYVAKLPWKADHAPLPTNRQISQTRTRKMVQKLPQDTLQVYDRIIQDQETRGFIERVDNDDEQSGHYLPHHAVEKDSVTTPIRVVFDCSCTATGSNPSLNDCLQKGPPLLNDLVSILLRFRTSPIAYISDIEKAFLHIGLHERDRDFTKFFWLSNPHDPDSSFAVYRFASVLFGSVSSPALLNAVLRTHLDNDDSDTAKQIARNIYVDNLVCGTDTDAHAIEHYHHANEITEAGGFKLRSWSSNCEQLRALATTDGVLHLDPIAPVLGMRWDTEKDCLAYKKYSATPPASGVLTKREVVKRVSTLYDPLGLLAPTHVKGKIFIQTLWKEDITWDQPLTEPLLQTWSDIEPQLAKATGIQIPRRPGPGLQTDEPVELHCFVDASTKAYGATIYLRQGETTGLLIAKTRVAPIKELTLPRLELMAALLGARLTKFVQQELASELIISERVLWSDSQITLSWLQSQQHLPAFVRNRVTEIQSVKFDACKYCPTQQNPADLLTRGIESDTLQRAELWWHGPLWLKHGDWPISKLYDSKIDGDLQEPDDDPAPAAHVTMVKTDTPAQGIASLLAAEKFSSMLSLHRVTARVLRFAHNVRHSESRITDPLISAAELSQANKAWIKSVQSSCYAREIQDLTSTQATPLARQLRLFLDPDGILRCGGRLHNAPITDSAKFPVLLPPSHPYTRMLIMDAHERTFHAGLQATVTLLRQTYWIPRIRVIVRSVIRKCFLCKRLSGPAYKPVLRAPLPEYRLHKAPPFTVTGVDFTGELYVKTDRHTHQTKCYVCLFTCANTRAVHLELVPDLSVHSFLQAFRRFCARRSTPHTVISDNATTYHSASRELKQLYTNPQVRHYMSTKSIDWLFIPKRAPWWGGFYERLIGLTKKSIQVALGRRFVTFSELATILCEVEAALNDRPLTYMYSDVADESPLTPSQLLHGRLLTTLPYEHVDAEEVLDPSYGTNTSELTQKQRQLSATIDRFWSKWTHEYLTALRERHDVQSKLGATENSIKPGTIVLVHADNKKRLHWDLAIVESLIVGGDGLARAANIRTKNGHTNRPITKLYPLETSDTRLHHTTDSETVTQPVVQSQQAQTVRPQRQAAQAALRKITQCLE